MRRVAHGIGELFACRDGQTLAFWHPGFDDETAAHHLGGAVDPDIGLPEDRLVHYPGHRPPVLDGADERSPAGHPAEERLRPVDRVDEPRAFPVGAAALAVLFADDPILRPSLFDPRAKHGLDLCVGEGHRIESGHAALVFGAERTGAGVEVPEGDLTRPPEQLEHGGWMRIRAGHRRSLLSVRPLSGPGPDPKSVNRYP